MRFFFLVGILALHVVLISCAVKQAGAENLISSKDAKSSRTSVRVPPILARRNKGSKIVTRLANKFSFNFFQKMARWEVKPVILSPLGFFIPLSILSYGAQGPTRDRFLSAIGLRKNETRIAKFGYKRLIDKLSHYNMRVRTKIFYAADLTPQPFFVKLVTKIFKADIERIPFDDKYVSAEKVNDWIKKQSNNEATELIKKPLEIGLKPSIVLVNVVYFKGAWDSPFDRSLTTQRPFYVHGETVVNTPTMYKFARMPYGRIESVHASFVSLPYKRKGAKDAVSMFIILPDYKGEMNEFVAYLNDVRMKDLLKAEMRDVELYLPKFKFEFSEELGDKLDHVLGEDYNPFRERDEIGNTKPAGRMSFGRSIIKYVVEVDEDGDETAGSTSFFDMRNVTTVENRNLRFTRASEVITFNADHPFIAVIATRRKLFLNLFTMNVNGFQFLPDGKIIEE